MFSLEWLLLHASTARDSAASLLFLQLLIFSWQPQSFWKASHTTAILEKLYLFAAMLVRLSGQFFFNDSYLAFKISFVPARQHSCALFSTVWYLIIQIFLLQVHSTIQFDIHIRKKFIVTHLYKCCYQTLQRIDFQVALKVTLPYFSTQFSSNDFTDNASLTKFSFIHFSSKAPNKFWPTEIAAPTLYCLPYQSNVSPITHCHGDNTLRD